MKHALRRRWMVALAGFTLAVSGVFGLFAMAFVYTVEDRFLERQLAAEAARQLAHQQRHGRWAAPLEPWMAVHTQAASLPPDLAPTLAAEPTRSEVAGTQGRHYHLLPLGGAQGPPWLVAEVSGQLIVRPMRETLLRWLVGWGLGLVAASLVLAAWLARRTSAPLERLAQQVAQARPDALPTGLAAGTRDDEVGALAHAFDALHERTRAFIGREQAFTRDASHELRTPLAVLRIGLERLLREEAEAGRATPRRHTLLALHASTLAMQQTVETLLALAREEPPAGGSMPTPTPAPTPLLPLVEQWVLRHADWLDRQALALELQLPASATLPLPPAVLEQALGNLLINALTHGAAGSTVRVAWEGGGLVIENENADAPVPGSGFGLDLVRRLLGRHGAVLVWTQQAAAAGSGARGRTRAGVQHTAGLPTPPAQTR